MKIINLLIVLIIASPSIGNILSPEEIINKFYTSRKLRKDIILQSMSKSGVKGSFSVTGKKASKEFLYDYEIHDIKMKNNRKAYAHVTVKTRTLKKGIVTTQEFWKLERSDGRWVIENIYIPKSWQIRKAIRRGSSLDEKVEAIAKFEFKYEKVPPGSPITKCFAYIQRRDFTKAYYWANQSVKKTYSAQSFFMRGLLNLILRRKKAAQNDLRIAIKKDRRYAVILQNLLSGKFKKRRSSGTGNQPSRSMTGKIGSWFNR